MNHRAVDGGYERGDCKKLRKSNPIYVYIYKNNSPVLKKFRKNFNEDEGGMLVSNALAD